MKHQIEEINGDNWRPGMPEQGWLVRYDFSPSCGWQRMRTFATEKEAIEFAESPEKEDTP